MHVTNIMLLWLLCCAALASCQRRAIKNLPRLKFEPNFNQYSGYLTSTNNKRLFYWLVESSHVSPSEAPLVLWLNGGPGCSSVGGLLMTNGPFLANDRAELERNELAWNRLANMLYIDSPNGVGLSESGTINRSVLNDQVTTELNLGALKHFFTLFPEYRARPFYITGESYAGIYIPLLAHAIQRSHLLYPRVINLKGIAVGNGLHVRLEDVEAEKPEFMSTVGISFGSINVNRTQKAMMINVYNIAEPCHYPLSDNDYQCLNSTGLVTYLNDNDVRAALGVQDTVSNAYQICDDQVANAYESTLRNVLPELRELANANITAMIYHGNLDFAIPIRVTQRLLEQLPQESDPSDGAWFYCFTKPGRDGGSSSSLQIGGLQKSYLRGMIRYRTVIGAGHSVATDRRDMAFQILEDFLNNDETRELTCK